VKKGTLTIIALLALMFNTNIVSAQKESFKTTVQFYFENEKVNIDKDFKILLIDSKGHVETISIQDNIVCLPKLDTDSKKVTLIVKYKQYQGTFKDVYTGLVKPTKDQDMEWVFGIDEAPFDRLIGAANEDDMKNPRYKRLFYWKFRPQDHGDGIMLIDRQTQ
jgi:hypothetical protein